MPRGRRRFDEVGQERNVAGVGEQGFVAVVARAVDGQSAERSPLRPLFLVRRRRGRLKAMWKWLRWRARRIWWWR